MDVNKMTSEDFMHLYFFSKAIKNISNYTTWHPNILDIENYNKTEQRFKDAWNKDKSLVHKSISLKPPQKEKADNRFTGCAEIGHRWELEIEKEFRKYGIDIGMYYDNRQFKGENDFGIEIKHDAQMFKYDKKYGTIFIEYLALNRDESKFINGALLKDDNSIYWLIGNETDGYFIFYKKTLLELYKKMVINKEHIDRCYLRERRTAKGIVIRLDKARELMIADNICEFLIKIGVIECA